MRGGAGHVAMLRMRELTTANPRNALQSVAGGEGRGGGGAEEA